MIYEFKFIERKIKDNVFYFCIEANTLEEADKSLKQKSFVLEEYYYELYDQIFDYEKRKNISVQFENLLNALVEKQIKDGLIVERANTDGIIDALKELIIIADYSILVSQDEKYSVYPTLDPTFERKIQ